MHQVKPKMSTPFDPNELSRAYAYAERCPGQFLPRLLSFQAACPRTFVEQFLDLRQALGEGRYPVGSTWPWTAFSIKLEREIRRVFLLELFRGQPQWVDAFLDDLLDALLSIGPSVKPLSGPESSMIEAVENLELWSRWRDRVWTWRRLGDLLGSPGRGFDLSNVVPERVHWTKLDCYASLLEKTPELRDFVERLGRQQPVPRLHNPKREALTSDVVEENSDRSEGAQGGELELAEVGRGAELSRMLACETALLADPELESVWQARRIDRGLLIYESGRRSQRPREVAVDPEKPRSEHRRGPMVLLVDRSGSMSGLREIQCKACVLGAVRIARREDRACLLVGYRGPGQVVEHEVAKACGDQAALLDFLSESFDGGTDIAGALDHVLDRIKEPEWVRADLAVLTDGEWPLTPSVLAAVQAQKLRGLRVYGLQVGITQRTSLFDICDDVLVLGQD